MASPVDLDLIHEQYMIGIDDKDRTKSIKLAKRYWNIREKTQDWGSETPISRNTANPEFTRVFGSKATVATLISWFCYNEHGFMLFPRQMSEEMTKIYDANAERQDLIMWELMRRESLLVNILVCLIKIVYLLPLF